MEMPPNLQDSEHYRRLAAEATAREAERRNRICNRPSGEERWYLTRTGPRFKEDEAKELFDEYGLEFYRPKLLKMVNIPLRRLSLSQRKSGLTYREPKHEAFLGKYLPVRFDWRRKDWRDVFDRSHLFGIIVSDEHGRAIPAPIRAQAVEELRAREVDGAISEDVKVLDLVFAIGERIKITGGVFAEKLGTFEGLANKSFADVDEAVRVKIGVLMLGRVNLVEMPLSYVAALNHD